ncbi:MAG: carbonic anhydrase [Granulicella sp.]
MADEVLEQLKAGILKFQSNVYPELRETFEQAVAVPQAPKTLIITCADSRIDPELITQSGPGELFTTRNIGNMIPAYPEMLGGVSAVLEYAVSVVKVKHVVVCGHMDCGAMKALMDPASLEGIPSVKSWLRLADTALRITRSTAPEGEKPEDFMRRLTEQNVLLQMKHLQTHPSIAEGMARGELTISGWVYDIGSGGVRISEDANPAFHPVEAEVVAG